MWKAWNQMLTLMINWIMTTISRDLKKINLFGFKEQFYTIELSLLFCFVSSTLEQVLRRGIWTLFTEVSCGTLIILRSTSMKQNVEIVEYISHVPNITSDMVKCFTPVIFPKFSILLGRKTRKLRHFKQKEWEYWMFYSSILIKLSVFLQISTQIQSQSIYFVKNSAWTRQFS